MPPDNAGNDYLTIAQNGGLGPLVGFAEGPIGAGLFHMAIGHPAF